MSLISEIQKINKSLPDQNNQQQSSQQQSSQQQSSQQQQQQNPDNDGGGQPPAEMDDASLLAAMSKSFGTTFASMDEAKAFISKQQGQQQQQQQQPAEPTEEQKRAAAQQRSIDVMQAFYAAGGTEEQYQNIQRILATDGVELTKKEILAELEAEGFSAEDALSIYKNRYFIVDEGEEDSPFTEGQVNFGKKRLAAMEQRLKDKAAEPLRKAADAIDSNKSIVEKWKGWESSVDEHFKTFTGETELSVKNNDGEEIAKIPVKLSAEEINEIKGQMKDANLLRDMFYNSDNTKGAKNISELLMWAQIGKTIASKAYDAGATETLSRVERTFPSQPLVRQITGETVKNRELKEKSQQSYTDAALDAFVPKRYRGKTGS